MKSLAVSVCALGLFAMPAFAGGGSEAYYIDDGALPWGDTLLNDAMNMVFGGGGWNDADYGGVDVGQLFSADTAFIYLEGSDGSHPDTGALECQRPAVGHPERHHHR